MPRGGARPGAGRPRKQTVAAGVSVPPDVPEVPEVEDPDLLPLDYMLRVMRNVAADPLRRDRMAVAAAPFVHRKLGEGGKKEGQDDDAKKVGKGKFGPAAPPRLVSNRG